jgi:hypothetical protein
MTVSRSTPGRILAVIIGVPLLLGAVGQGVLTVTGLLARSSEHHQASYAWHGGTLKLDNDDGNVTLRRSSSTATVSVAYTAHFGLKKPTVSGQLTAAGLQLEAKCPSGIFDNYCSVDYTVLVPTGVPLQLTTGDGTVSFDGIDAPITVHSGDGKVHGTDLRAADVNTSSGDGSVSLQWATAPEHVKVSAGDGSVNLSVPSGSGPYAITKHVGDGHSGIEVAEDPKASRTMVLDLGDGSLVVH